MDINGFREPQSPWFFTQPPEMLIESRVSKLGVPKKETAPAPDNRFPGWAAQMSDGRLATDYRPHCAVNIPTGEQFASRVFMQQNASLLMQQSRKRQADKVGAGLPYDSVTVMPPVAKYQCTPSDCTYIPIEENGVGIERTDASPALFGTFATSRPSLFTPAKPTLTKVQEGGRNSRRGGTMQF